MENELLRKGDKVVMHTCIEAEKYNGKIWICKGDEFTKGEGVYKQNLVFLEGFSGYFSTEYLQKIDLSELYVEDFTEELRVSESGNKQLCGKIKRLVEEKETLINALRFIKDRYESDLSKEEITMLLGGDKGIYNTVIKTLKEIDI